jgi:hypothetical protein
MLSYLVKSRARRLLLELLFVEGATGTASDLARLAGVAFASAHRELRELARFGLVTTTAAGGKVEYRAADHADAHLLRQLVLSGRAPTNRRPDDADHVRRRLRGLGAPLQVSPELVAVDDVEAAVVDGVRLARKDPTVARVMPHLLWRHRHRLDRNRLETTARARRQKHALGFLLALTAELRKDRDLAALARSFRDHRVRASQDFFELPRSTFGRRLSEVRTPAVARAWGFRMNMELPTFEAMFEKFPEESDA